MRKVLKWSLAAVATLATMSVVLLYNPNLVKGLLERHVSGLTGYPVSIAGDLDISLGKVTELSIADLHIAAPGWSSQAGLVSLDLLVLKLDTASLFKQTIIIDSIGLHGLQANLETSVDGEKNWVVDNKRTPDGSKTRPGFIVTDIRLDDVTVNHLDPATGKQRVLRISTLSQHRLENGMLGISLEGSFNNRPIEFSGAIGPFDKLLQGQDVAFSGSGVLGNLDIQGKGRIDDLKHPRLPQFDLQVQGHDIDQITTMLGIDDLGSGDFYLSAVGGVVDNRFESSISGEFGAVSLHFSARATDLSSLDELDLELTANGSSLGAVTRIFGVQHWPDKPFRLNGSATRVGNTLNIPQLMLTVGGTELVLDALLSNFPGLDSSRIKLGIMGDDIAQFRQLLGIKGFVNGPFEVRGRLDVSPQQMESLQINVTTTLGKMALSGTLGSAPAFAGSRLDLHLDGDNANRLMGALGIDALPPEPYSLDTHIETTENGLVFEKRVLITIMDERLELGGFVSLSPGNKGTDVQLLVSGQHPQTVLGDLIGGLEFADLPYEMKSRVRILSEGLRFDDFTARFADIELLADGLLNLGGDKPVDFDFDWQGENFSAIGDFIKPGFPLDALVPGLPYRVNGGFSMTQQGFKLADIKGQIGNANVSLSGLISQQPLLNGTRFRFSLEGPDLHDFIDRGLSDVPPGAFKASADVAFHDDKLNITNFNFEVPGIHAEAGLVLGLPFNSAMDAVFDINLRGDDIRHLVPQNNWFKPSRSEYHIKAAGHRTGDLVGVQYFDMKVGALAITARGGTGDKTGEPGTHITFSAMADDLSSLGRFNGRQLPALPVDIKTEFTGHARQFALRDFHASVGQSEITGRMDVALHGAKPEISLQVQSNLIDLGPFLDVAGNDVNTGPDAQDDRVIPALPLPFALLEKADTGFSLNIDEIRLSTNQFFDLVLEGETANGTLRIPRLSWRDVRGGQLLGSLTIEPLETGAANVKIGLDAEHIVFGYTGLTKGQPWFTPEMDIRFHARGSGSNLQELASTSSGRFFLGSQGGTLKDVNLSLLDTFFLDEIFGLILAKADEHENDLVLTCVAVAFDVNNGLMETDPVYAMTTDKIHLVGKGALDLKTEALHFNFNATPNNALKMSASELLNPYILVGGTLGQPDIGIDPSKVLVYGGAAIGTAGISILAKAALDRMGATAPSCEKILEQETPH